MITSETRSSFVEPLLSPATGAWAQHDSRTDVPRGGRQGADRTDITQAAADLIHAFNDADWERFRSWRGPNSVYTEAGTGRRAEGADAYLEPANGWKEDHKSSPRRGSWRSARVHLEFPHPALQR